MKRTDEMIASLLALYPAMGKHCVVYNMDNTGITMTLELAIPSDIMRNLFNSLPDGYALSAKYAGWDKKHAKAKYLTTLIRIIHVPWQGNMIERMHSHFTVVLKNAQIMILDTKMRYLSYKRNEKCGELERFLGL